VLLGVPLLAPQGALGHRRLDQSSDPSADCMTPFEQLWSSISWQPFSARLSGDGLAAGFFATDLRFLISFS
jgi:hypothetical protein